MQQHGCNGNPELWFRPSPVLSWKVLLKLIENEEIIVTPRLGARNGFHPKGYAPGQIVVLRLFNENRRETMKRRVRITAVRSKPLKDWDETDLGRSVFYSTGWRTVQRDLSFFEGRPIGEDEMVSLIEFVYLPS